MASPKPHHDNPAPTADSSTTPLDALKASLADSYKSTGEYLDGIKTRLVDYGSEIKHDTSTFFESGLERTKASLQSLKESADKVSDQIDAANKQHYEELEDAMAKLRQNFDDLKTQASDYDAQFNAKVGEVFNQQQQNVEDGWRSAKEHLDALVHPGGEADKKASEKEEAENAHASTA
ncbi:Aste57867_16497 [Aphanomyces stellatus]|uniref:Aste57867_16497 protein n=1 Tax=Aphanomyces stellatus TaxID=120398 RepID=A0A485L6E1_9STRA|nr:hypothetical protein As57867_016440 [Aphanomyces stellatus]VFT93271.1 Aste57867_16497 [Aphanomyces stellatus]